MPRWTVDALTAALVIMGTLAVCDVWVTTIGWDEGQTSFREAPRQSDALWHLFSRQQ